MGSLRDRMRSDLERAGLAARTIEEYLRAVADLARFHRRNPAELTQDDLRQWDLDLLRRRLRPSSRNVYHAAVRFLYRRTLGRPDLVSCLIRPRVVSGLPRVLSPAEVALLLAQVKLLKYRVLFALLYDTGLRISEAAGLRAGDVERLRGVLQVREGKGGRARQVKLGSRLLALLERYWREVRLPEGGGIRLGKEALLFVSSRGGPLSVTCAQRVIRLAAAACGLAPGVTPHTLRHSFATAQLEAGTNLRVLQAQMGHVRIDTTRGYLHVATHLLLRMPCPLDALEL